MYVVCIWIMVRNARRIYRVPGKIEEAIYHKNIGGFLVNICCAVEYICFNTHCSKEIFELQLRAMNHSDILC